MSIELVMPSNHLILCHPLPLLPSIIPSIRVFSSESVTCIRLPEYWGFGFNISPFNEYSGLISFRMDCLDLLAAQGTLKSLTPQFKSINSLTLSFIYSPALTSIHNYWKNHTFVFAIRVMSSAYVRLLIFLQTILIQYCASSSPAFLMVYSAYKLHNQGDDIRPWCTPFLIWNNSVVPCPVLAVASWPAHRFLRRQVRLKKKKKKEKKVVWYSHLLKNCPQFVEVHTKALV